jgi:hypothetical protein
MYIYMGYGFDTNDIEDKTWYNLAKKYDAEAVEEHLKDSFDCEITDDEVISEEYKITDALDFINENNIDCCEYLRNIINSEESKKAGTNYIVTSYDNYLVFDSIRFADDSKRTEYIRNADEFIAMVGRYIPTENIHFGNLYEGNDWLDPSYVLE